MNKLLVLALVFIANLLIAQNSVLAIYCDGQNSPNDFLFGDNTFYMIDTDTVDYSGCSPTPAFHVAIIDDNCMPWGTKWTDHSLTPPVVYNPFHDFGQYNSDGFCRDRVEYFFIFRHDNQNELRNMDTLLNSIPNGYSIAIYSWMYSNTHSVDSLAPELITTLHNLGFSLYTVPATQNQTITFSVIKGDISTVMAASGGQTGAFLAQGMDMNCINTSLTEDKFSLSSKAYPNPTTGITYLTQNHSQLSILSIYNQSGQLVSNERVVGNTIAIDLTGFTNGLYIYTLNDLNGSILNKGKLIKE